jgi:hypothetical protein
MRRTKEYDIHINVTSHPLHQIENGANTSTSPSSCFDDNAHSGRNLSTPSEERITYSKIGRLSKYTLHDRMFLPLIMILAAEGPARVTDALEYPSVTLSLPQFPGIGRIPDPLSHSQSIRPVLVGCGLQCTVLAEGRIEMMAESGR